MKVLVVGSGAREHAIVWALSRSTRVSRLFAAPGNPGMTQHATCIGVTAPGETATWAARTGIDLVIVGPEDALASGVAEHLRQAGIPTVGPGTAGARLESSKSWAKSVCRDAGIPVGDYETFTDSTLAKSYCRALGAPVVVKADGLAQGKGAVVCRTLDEADRTIEAMLDHRELGESGATVVVEQFLDGYECSYMFFTDGSDLAVMPTTQDHKPVRDGDTGPHTGGMGAYTPVRAVGPDLESELDRLIGTRLISALAARDIDYRGVVCANLMITADGPSVLEFNARFGDPEAEVVLPLLEADLVDVAEAIHQRRLGALPVVWSDRAALSVAMAAEGYPGRTRTGDTIHGYDGVEADGGSFAFLGRTARAGDDLVTAGGRVVVVTGTGTSFEEAATAAYDRVATIRFDGEHHRTDIGRRSVWEPAR
ncbi:phosphoribosylamine--glycine ligase [Cellulomonas terrae]|uniref:Phosphoribosylamine--glycine ligase n=1 Tax=Cellulomonas terrae TaxID=311234 RepID=A0A511JK28_9CELL|nr:phosphoribosylamine--glycine ligase [Cellulomonas terrae]GEL98362.1 phosphoribosylamine--glycine ligase [Cellulomonas terrae]